MPTRLQDASREISIHALREEGDFTPLCNLDLSWSFLSTPSARRATRWSTAGARSSRHFYPRPPRGGRPDLLIISKTSGIFLSTPSARRATLHDILRILADDISIHALREEGDRSPPKTSGGNTNFYPRPPRGGRPLPASAVLVSLTFLSTPSARRATDRLHKALNNMAISIHALREEGDGSLSYSGGALAYFYPRPPRGGRRVW